MIVLRKLTLWLWGLWLTILFLHPALVYAEAIDAEAKFNLTNKIATLRVTQVKVRLKIYRQGDPLASGKRIPQNQGIVEGEAEYLLSRPARAGETIHLLNFSEFLRKNSQELQALDAMALSTYLDGPFTPGGLELVNEHLTNNVLFHNGRQFLEVFLAPGQDRFRLYYRVHVPRRYWPFGCSRQRCSLSGGIAPLPSQPAKGGYYLPQGERVVDPVEWQIEDVRFASVPDWQPGTIPTAKQAKKLDDYEIIISSQSTIGSGQIAYPAVFWGPRWRRVRGIHRGVEIEILHMFWRPGDQFPHERKAQLYHDIPGHLLSVAKETIDVALSSNLPLEADRRVLIVQGPLRSQIAEFHPGAIIVSDQMLQVFPGRRLIQLHRAAVARSLFEMFCHQAYAGLHSPSTDVWLSGTVAIFLLDLWTSKKRHGDDMYAQDILSNFAFVPAVDNFLYTGQAEFTNAYFRGIEDIFLLRNHPLWFTHHLPTGRRIHEKLRNLMSRDQLVNFYQKMLENRARKPQNAAEQSYGYSLDWFFDQWLGPYPHVDYSVQSVQSNKHGQNWQHQITIQRTSHVPLIEPVQVLAREQGGEPHYLLWNGQLNHQAKHLLEEQPTGRYTWELITKNRLASVHIDPRNRLLETPLPPHTNVDPLFNNRYPTSFRFVYTGFGLNIAASEFFTAQTLPARFNAITGFVAFEASKRRDLRYTGHISLSRGRESPIAIAGGGNLWFGDKINGRRRRARIRLSGSIGYLNTTGLDPRGGVRLTQSVALIDDTQAFAFWPQRGHQLALSLSSNQVIRTSTSTNKVQDHRYHLTISGGWSHLWPLAHQHILASNLSASAMIPIASQPEYRSLLRVGGIGGLDAYGGNELFTRLYLLAQMEYRHVYWRNADINLFHLAWLRSIGGVVSTGVATMTHCDDYQGIFARNSFYGQIGYGLTAYLRLLGVTPQYFRLAFAVPLVRRQTTCLGNQLPEYLAQLQGLHDPRPLLPPLSVNITFTQPY